jgi:hypothetical protein
VDSPTLAFAPDGSLLWGGVVLGTVEANAGNPYAFDTLEVNGRSLISNNGAVSTTGMGMATLGNTVYVAWVPSGANVIMINAYAYPSWTLVNTINTGESVAGNPVLLAFNGQLYLYWTGTNADHNLNSKLIAGAPLGSLCCAAASNPPPGPPPCFPGAYQGNCDCGYIDCDMFTSYGTGCQPGSAPDYNTCF